MIHLEEPIRSVGAHEVRVRLHPEVNATLNVEIEAA
jgi:ribosomal protein L9